MEPVISPQEFYYLYSPVSSDAAHLFKYTLLGLCFDGHARAYYREIYITKNARYKRPRIFVKRGPAYKPENKYTSSEKFVLSLLSETEMRLYELRNEALLRLDGDIRNFKYEFVFKYVNARGLCFRNGY